MNIIERLNSSNNIKEIPIHALLLNMESVFDIDIPQELARYLADQEIYPTDYSVQEWGVLIDTVESWVKASKENDCSVLGVWFDEGANNE